MLGIDRYEPCAASLATFSAWRRATSGGSRRTWPSSRVLCLALMPFALRRAVRLTSYLGNGEISITWAAVRIRHQSGNALL